jgi:hypothetical protein
VGASVAEAQQAAANFGWDQLGDYSLPSVNEAKAAGNTFSDDLEDGTYTFAIVDISPQLANNFNKKDGSPGNPRRGLTLRVVQSDVDEDVGLQTVQYYTESMHPKSSMYDLMRVAAFGGKVPADVRPRLADLNDKQFKGSLITKPSENDPSKLVQKLEGLLPSRKTYPIPERQRRPVTAEGQAAPWDDANA